MTPDLMRLRDSLPALGPIVERLELELVDDPRWGEPSDTSYLSEADRQNPDIAANIDAMAATNNLISWFGRDAEGFLGLWHGPKQRAAGEAPVVRLDTEGQYSIVAATLPEYLAIAMPEDEFATTRETLTGAGFKVGFNPDAIWAALDLFDDDPNAYRNELYEQNRVARGLPRSDAEEAEPQSAPVGDATEPPEAPSVIDEGWGAEPAALPPPPAAAPIRHNGHAKPAAPAQATTSAVKPAKKAAAKPAKKAAAKPAKKAAAKPAKRAAPGKKAAPAKKAAAKPAKKAAAKPAKKAAKPATRAAKKSAPTKKPTKTKAKGKKR